MDAPATRTRLHYVDWLRVLAVLLLIPFHSARVFDIWDPFYAKNAQTSVPLSWLIAAINVWHMPLLFLLAGASTWFALAHRTPGRYRRERLLRLGVPLLFGVFVIVPPQAWFGAMTNAGYEGGMFAYLRSPAWHFDLSQPDYIGLVSPAHLWFILFLLVIALVTQPLLSALRRRARPASLLSRLAAVPGGLLLLTLPMLFIAATPEIGGKALFDYMALYVIGALIFSAEDILERLEMQRWTMLVLGLVGLVPTLALWFSWGGAPDLSLQSVAHELLKLATMFAMMFAAVGWGRRLLNRDTPLLRYLAESSYPFYILHQTVIVALGFLIVQLPWGVAPKYLLLMAASLATTFAIYEAGIRHWNPMRFLFGMKPRTKPRPPATVAAESA